MEIRQHIFEALTTDPDLNDLLGTYIAERGTITQRLREGLFLTYAITSARPYPGFEGPKQHNFSFFVHDVPGDYLNIDKALSLIDDIMASLNSTTTADFIAATFIERSGDFIDSDLNTFYRYTRHQVTTRR